MSGPRGVFGSLDISGVEAKPTLDLKKITGGCLVQEPDSLQVRSIRRLPVATKRKPTAA